METIMLKQIAGAGIIEWLVGGGFMFFLVLFILFELFSK